MLCLSPSSTLKLIDSLGSNFDQKVVHWWDVFFQVLKGSTEVRLLCTVSTLHHHLLSLQVHPPISLGISHLDDLTDQGELDALEEEMLDYCPVEGSLQQKSVETCIPSSASSLSISFMKKYAPPPGERFTLT